MTVATDNISINKHRNQTITSRTDHLTGNGIIIRELNVVGDTHGREFAVETFNRRSNGSDLSTKTKRRTPTDTVAPASSRSKGRGSRKRSISRNKREGGRLGRRSRGKGSGA